MQRGFFIVAGAGVVCAACFLLLRSTVADGIMLADVVLAATATTLVLAAISAVFSVLALMNSRQARAETTRLARSIEVAFRARAGGPISIKVGDAVAAAEKRPAVAEGKKPDHAPAEPASTIMALSAGLPAEHQAGRSH